MNYQVLTKIVVVKNKKAGKMTNTEIINKLRNELEQLRQKIMNLEIFLMTNKMKTLSDKAQDLLYTQKEVMIDYQNILIERIALLQDLIDGGEK